MSGPSIYFQPVMSMIFTRAFIAVFLLIAITSTVVTFILPESYASTARVSVDADPSGECKVIQSEAVLGQVIEKLDLKTVWGRRYNGGNNLNVTNAIQLLKKRMEVRPERNTSLINITVFSEDKNEAAQIANAVAESYQQYRQKTREELASQSLAVLQEH